MKIIPPYQISSEIIQIIHQSREYLILVSPYWEIGKWEVLKSELAKAKNRGVKIKAYARMENDNFKSWEQLEALGIKPLLVKNLHAKVYFNENRGLVTSMNLLLSSNLSGIEFGAIYDSIDELNELKSFVKSYLTPNVEKQLPTDDELYLSKEKFTSILINILQQELQQDVTCRWDGSSFALNAGNQFFFNIDKVKNTFYIYGIISGLEHNNFNRFLAETKAFQHATKFELAQNSISANMKKKLSTSHFDHLMVNEKVEVIDCAVNFVLQLLSFKQYCYDNRKSLS